MHADACPYPHIRIHWTDPSLDQVDFLDEVDTMVNNAMMFKHWNYNDYPLVAQHFKSKSDLFKLITSNRTVMKEITRIDLRYRNKFTLSYIATEFWRIYEEEKEIVGGVWRETIASMSRFALDVYTVARMLKKENSSNVFYGGEFHARNICTMLGHVFQTRPVNFDV